MTIKKKAEELINYYYNLSRGDTFYERLDNAKQCALKAVYNTIDEISDISVEPEIKGSAKLDVYLRYWNDVKQEIEKL